MVIHFIFAAVLTKCILSERDFGGIDLSELEFLVSEMSTTECQQLADALTADRIESDVEEGVTCLDDLLRHESALENEGSNVARGVFKHMLNQIGRQDLAEWLSIAQEPMAKNNPKSAGDSDDCDSEDSKKCWSWYDTAITVALIYTGTILLWLVIHILVRKTRRDQCMEASDPELNKKPPEKPPKKKRKPKRSGGQSQKDEAPGEGEEGPGEGPEESPEVRYHHYYNPPRNARVLGMK